MRHPNHDDSLHVELDDEVGEKKTQWNGSAVEVTAHLVPRFLWSTASIDVFLDGRCILSKRAASSSLRARVQRNFNTADRSIESNFRGDMRPLIGSPTG